MSRLSLITLLLLSASANAATVMIDFDGQTPGAGAPLTIDGYTFSDDGPTSNSVIEESGNNSFGVNDFWTCQAFSCGMNVIGLDKQDGNNFALHSVGIEISDGGSLSVYGHMAGGGLASGLIGSSDWLNLTDVTFFAEFTCDPCGGQYNQLTVDNISVSAVPVPAAVWLFGSALAGLGWLRRKPTM